MIELKEMATRQSYMLQLVLARHITSCVKTLEVLFFIQPDATGKIGLMGLISIHCMSP